MEKETKNEIVETNNTIGGNNLISNDANIFRSDIKKFTTLNLDDEDDQLTLLNSMQACDVKLNDIVDQTIEVNGCYIEERPVENVDEETGEVKPKSKYITMLFGTDGKSYVAGSYGVYNSLSQLASVKGFPSKNNVYKLKVIKVPARTQGHFLLKLIMVK